VSRALLAVAGLVACAFLALGVRQQTSLSGAHRIAFNLGPPHPGDRRHVDLLLGRAGTLNPDAAVDLTRAQWRLRAGDRSGAIALATAVARREPRNIDAWTELLFATGRGDPLHRRAQAAIRRLSPPVPAP
jgi:hypothetical protein